MLSAFALTAAMLAPTTVAAPTDARALICAAAAEGDRDMALRIARLAAKAEPSGEASFAALAKAIEASGQCPVAEPAKADDTTTEDTKPKAADLKGSLEFGLGQTSGPTDAANANIAALLENSGERWSQKLRATLDYQDIEGIAAAERYTASWDLRRGLSKTAFVTGLATFESDRIAGFRRRTTQSLGFGGKFSLASKLALNVSGGPSWRQIEWFGDRDSETQFGARGSAALDWILAPGVSLAASGSGIFEANSGTLEGQASITGKLIGPLATRFQLTARHETNPYPGIEPTTTTSRASIVYSF
ncbi:DUF481 domain-containing protein [Sphingopyxis macrogoltabida]|uniref:DUF481 domain-containing protein n=1 Tax=Sphingopyxis macrogoltabida TaxID=33050 RepID=A0AAC9FFZ8_SPHMC|nr:DUF481 domain-containing protein [Sphingopyxis macrogoltabida]ALJ14695.1 hypothetical protein LH19_17640 [Sphingopyxis macrogoltabida]AMU90953.1 hypothetical protein ATM17_18210 [Sphingopyxis macrogoltabida]